jgi:hypothetical protein
MSIFFGHGESYRFEDWKMLDGGWKIMIGYLL